MTDLPTINLALYAQTDVGMVRSGNEDNFLILDLSTGKSWTAIEEEPSDLLTYSQGYYGTLLAVSDGMGGALAGEVASRMAVETVRDRMLQLQAHPVYSQLPFSERLRVAVEQANFLIHGESQTNPMHKGLGATFTAVAAQGGVVYFAQVGDSRAYLIRNGNIARITKDQSLVQQLIDAGQITEEEAETHSYRNVILQALGAHSMVNVEVNTLPLCQLDTLVLCSDGLSGKIHQDEIARIVHEASDFKSACQDLINLANERGGEDNITVVVAQFSGNGLPSPPEGGVDPQSLARSPSTPTEINWSLGAKTDPLTYEEEEIPLDMAAASRATEPLPVPPPPSHSQPFTSGAPKRETQERPRRNDLSDRRGPITSVFGPDSDDDSSAEAETNNSPAGATTPIEKRSTKPLESAATAAMAAASTAVPSAAPAQSASSRDESADTPSRANQILLIGLIIMAIAALLIGAASYLRKQANERESQQQAQAKLILDNQKEGQVRRLRDKIDEIHKKLTVQATDKPALKKTLDSWQERLEKLSSRLDEVSQMSSQPPEPITQICEEIGKELQKIEDDLNNLQGLLPSPLSNRDPVRV